MCRRFVLRLGHRFSKIYEVILRKQALKNRLCSSTFSRLRLLEHTNKLCSSNSRFVDLFGVNSEHLQWETENSVSKSDLLLLMPQREHKPLKKRRSFTIRITYISKRGIHIALTLLKVATTLFTNIKHVSFGSVFTFALNSHRINLDLWSCWLITSPSL